MFAFKLRKGLALPFLSDFIENYFPARALRSAALAASAPRLCYILLVLQLMPLNHLLTLYSGRNWKDTFELGERYPED